MPPWTNESLESEELVLLYAESPARMTKAVLHRAVGIRANVGSVHRLKKEVVESETFELLWTRSALRVDKF